MATAALGERFALDLQGLQHLKHTAREDSPAALREASKQFEALFLQAMLKSMRKASPQSGLFDSEQTRLYTELLDQQWAQHLAGRGLGLAEQLADQLRGAVQASGAVESAKEENLLAGIPRATPKALYGALAPSSSGSGRSARSPEDSLGAVVERPAHVTDFLARLREPAQRASRASGVPAELILAQAALETGWGRRQIATADGDDSYNLFGIKAGSRWRGATADVLTTEYVDGQAQKRVERFRAYPTLDAALSDYARLIGGNPRYAGVVAAPDSAQAARELQQAGYATDPAYADKLIAVMASFGPLGQTQEVAGLDVGGSPRAAD
ncbi:flagellar assembly peptidoglycan hydrolase FlgJ [Azorhizophilus paspali]|uniref:Peptidoglycan hydrolase FlgJ n=1 Tax=Azorhizophilus paspali TaxID=69963 RepID=A0ABV6SIJ9_AZOPA